MIKSCKIIIEYIDYKPILISELQVERLKRQHVGRSKIKNEPNQINFNQKKRVDIDENSLSRGAKK
jgi:hypothetical protein